MKFDHVLGTIVGAAAGDAMGSATETMTPEQISHCYNGKVKSFMTPVIDSPSYGRLSGQVTDDFSQAYYLMKSIIKANGLVSHKVGQEALLEWALLEQEIFQRFAGPTTRSAIIRMSEKGFSHDIIAQPHPNAKATNGAAMKIFPLGLLNYGNVDKAIEDAVIVSQVTHNNQLAISGACAIAAAVSIAVVENSYEKVLEASIYGAVQGEKLGKKKGVTVAGPSVVERMMLAIELSKKASSPEEAMDMLYNLVGTGIHVSEAIPSAIGLLSATKGDAEKGIIAAVNIGNDTDTIATILGAITGALRGAKSQPEEWAPILNRQNHYNLESLALSFYDVMNK